MELLKKNLVLIGIIVCVVLAATWYGLASSGGADAGISVSEQEGVLVAKEGNGTVEADPDVLKLLLDMRSIKLDDRLFKSPAFRILQDTGKEIITEPKGRENPFAPTGSDGFGDETFGDDDTSETTGKINIPNNPSQFKRQNGGRAVPVPQE